VPRDVEGILNRLWDNGHAAFLVGGGVRDALLGRPGKDWDIATDARPERILELFPAGRYENRFGTVTMGGVEVTTFRRDHVYGDHRRPDSVTFSDDIIEDLGRRDFTVNAIAWGRAGRGAEPAQPTWVDPTGGLQDLELRRLRAVGDPAARFEEDALRLLRAARLAAQLDFEIEASTRAQMAARADLARWVSNERVGAELRRMLAADPPSAGFRIMADAGLLGPLLPELTAQIGLPQTKATGHDLWEHSLATLDAAAQLDPANQRLRLAALLHDVGKPETFADGRFIGHDIEGARIAAQLLTRLAFPRGEVDGVAELIRRHMFSYERHWTNAAVRRFLRRVGSAVVEDLLTLREADNMGSGLPAGAGDLDQLRRRVRSELDAGVPLGLSQLAVDGRDLMAELGMPPGPAIGRLLDRLLDSVVADPTRNTRQRLLADARAWAREMVATR